MASKSDYYDILGVPRDATLDEIKKAYRKQALEWHPDRHSGAEKEVAEKRFKEINEAYQVLSDPEKRRAYDLFGHQAFAPGGGVWSSRGEGEEFVRTGRWGPFTYTTYSSSSPFSGFDFGDPFEIFESFFGFDTPFRRPRKPRYSINIDFMEAVKGVEKEVEVEGRKRRIKIPAGVDEGSRIEFKDFILSINVRPHKLFEREGDDIFVDVFIPYSLAVLGGEVTVPTIDGEVKIRLRQFTKPGTMIRLRGRGVPHLNSRGRGDEYVRVNILVPDSLNSRQKDLIETLRKEGL